jgi:hypothetical protein
MYLICSAKLIFLEQALRCTTQFVAHGAFHQEHSNFLYFYPYNSITGILPMRTLSDRQMACMADHASEWCQTHDG